MPGLERSLHDTLSNAPHRAGEVCAGEPSMNVGKSGFALRGRNPDVLTCIANLSNDEVFTPPELANRMLDTLTTPT
ncbi:MAG: hypothetical protein EPN36_01160 [Rhodanobacteraceae bacterium]|nr:MAG: hypothetical protein EPN36_01160 [Rhodanobacteraceae bacterium]